MGVDVDEPGRDDVAGGVEDSLRRVSRSPISLMTPSVTATVGGTGRCSGPVDDRTAPDHQVVRSWRPPSASARSMLASSMPDPFAHQPPCRHPAPPNGQGNPSKWVRAMPSVRAAPTNLDARVGSGDACAMSPTNTHVPDRDASRRLPRPHRRRGRGAAVTGPGPGDLLLEVSHCGICGSDIHFVIEGRSDRLDRGPRVRGARRRGRSTQSADGRSATRSSAARATLRHVRVLPGRSAVALHRPQHRRVGADDNDRRRVRRVHAATPPRRCGGSRRHLSLRAAALAEPLAVALHGLTRGGVQAGHRAPRSPARGPIGALSVAAARPVGVTDIVVSEPTPARRALCRAARRGHRRARRPRRAAVAAATSSPSPSTSRSMLGPRRAHGGRAHAAQAGLDPRARRRRHGSPEFDTNRILLNELAITGAFVYDADGFDRASSCSPAPTSRPTCSSSPSDFPPRRALRRDRRAPRRNLAAKVMIVPARKEHMT